MRLCTVWRNPKRVPVACGSLFDSSEVLQDDAKVVVSFDQVWLEPQRSPVAGHRFIMSSYCLQSRTHAAMGLCQVWPNLHCSPVASHCRIELPLFELRVAQFALGAGVTKPELLNVWIGLKGRLEIGQGGGKLVDLHSQYAQIVVRIWVIRLRMQDRLIETLSVLQLPCPMVPYCLLQDLVYRNLSRVLLRDIVGHD